MAYELIPVSEQWQDTNSVNANGYVLKTYLVGTTTPVDMSTDQNGGTTTATLTATADGFWALSGNEVKPYTNLDSIRYAIYENATDASNNTNAYYGPIDIYNLSDNSSITSSTAVRLFRYKYTSGVSGDGISGSDIQTDLGITLAAGDLIETNHYNLNYDEKSGGKFQYTGTTTLAKAGNVPDADGFYYDAIGKQFSKVTFGDNFSKLQFTFASDANDSLTAVENVNSNIEIQSGVLTADRTLTIAGQPRSLYVDNKNAYNITIGGAGATAKISASERRQFIYDGSNILKIDPDNFAWIDKFGATSGGAVDCSAAIQAAIDSIVSYGVICVPPGIWLLDSTVTVPIGKRISFFGAGTGSLLYADSAIGTFLQLEQDTTYTASEVIQDRIVSKLSFFLEDSVVSDTVAIRANKNHQTIIEKCFFGQFLGTTSPDTTTGDRYTRYSNLIGIYCEEINNAVINSNFFVQIKRGIELRTDVDDVTVSNNNASYCYDNLLRMNDAEKVVITGNAAEEMFFGHAFRLQDCDDCTLSVNSASECYNSSGFFLQGCDNNVLVGLTAIQNQLARGGMTPAAGEGGIRLNTSSYNIINGCRSGKGLQKYGVVIDDAGSTGNYITYNNLRNNVTGAILDNGTSTVKTPNIT